MLVVVVDGEPRPQGSKSLRVQTTASGRTSARMYESSNGLKPWRAKVRLAAEEAILSQGWSTLRDVPIRATFTFTLPTPLTVAARIRRAPGKYPAWRGYDTDKLARAVCDSLTDAGAWDDDSRVTHLLARKLWAGSEGAMPSPGLVIEVREHWT
jgi:Holliday junction resolvase RusA-like endonuclease